MNELPRKFIVTYSDEMWSVTSNRILGDVSCELTTSDSEHEESDELVKVLNADWNVPTEQFHFAFTIEA